MLAPLDDEVVHAPIDLVADEPMACGSAPDREIAGCLRVAGQNLEQLARSHPQHRDRGDRQMRPVWEATQVQ
jgi:hypothetical protein